MQVEVTELDLTRRAMSRVSLLEEDLHDLYSTFVRLEWGESLFENDKRIFSLRQAKRHMEELTKILGVLLPSDEC